MLHKANLTLTKRLMAVLIFTAMSLLAIWLATMSVGCSTTKGNSEAYTNITYPDGSVYIRDTRSKGSTVAPPGATPGTLDLKPDGTVGGSTGTGFEKTVQQITAENSTILYSIGAVAIIGAAFAIWKAKITLGIGLAIAGTGLIFLPQVSEIVAPWIALLVIVSLVGGIVYAFGIYRGWWEGVEKERNATAKLAAERAEVGDIQGAWNAISTAPTTRKAVAEVKRAR